MRLLFLFMTLFVGVACANTQENTKRTAAFNESIKRGAVIYEEFCMNCHLPDGKGEANTFPPLAKSDFLMDNRTASIKAIKYGQKGTIVVNGVTYNNAMAPMGLTDKEIADVMNYITTSWGNKNDNMINISEVSKIEE